MSVRRQSLVLFSLLLGGTSCALFPATNQNEPRGRMARPTIEKTTQRTREGSDVTVPNETNRDWSLRNLVPCDSTAPVPPGGYDCRRTDQRIDTLRAPIDTATKKRP